MLSSPFATLVALGLVGIAAGCNDGDCRSKYIDMLSTCASAKLYKDGAAFSGTGSSSSGSTVFVDGKSAWQEGWPTLQNGTKYMAVTSTSNSDAEKFVRAFKIGKRELMSVDTTDYLGFTATQKLHVTGAYDLWMMGMPWDKGPDCPSGCQDKLKDWYSKCGCMDNWNDRDKILGRWSFILNLNCTVPGIPWWGWLIIVVSVLMLAGCCIAGTFAMTRGRS